MKSTFRYNHKSKEWDYIIKNFMRTNLTLVIKPDDCAYPAKREKK